MTSAELADDVGLSVVQIEAMTEAQVKALMMENKNILNEAAYEGEAELDWPYDSEYIVHDNFEVDGE